MAETGVQLDGESVVSGEIDKGVDGNIGIRTVDGESLQVIHA